VAKLVTKFGYIKPNGTKNVSGYVKYIATREGVMIPKGKDKSAPVTPKQLSLLSQLLKDFSDSKKSLEYADYKNNPTAVNASEFISRTIEENMCELKDTKTYADYIATRPNVEKVGTHGLFSYEGMNINLSKVSDELKQHNGNVWTMIVSLRREDAERLGFNTADRWKDMLRSQVPQLAKSLKVPMKNLKWYAAFHNESHHPHIHLIAYSMAENEGYLSKTGIEQMRSSLANDIFEQELLSEYKEQTKNRDELKLTTKDVASEIVREINSGMYSNPELQIQFVALAEKLAKTKGKLQYGYVNKSIKGIIDSIVDMLERNDRISALYDLWYENRYAILKTYTDEIPEKVPLSQNKEFKSIKNMIISSALEISSDILVVGQSNETSENEVSKAKHIVVNAIHDNYLPTEELNKAYKTLLEAAEKNDSSADYLLGRFHSTCPSVLDYEKAILYLKESSKNGNHYASFQLGKIFYFGNDDIERDAKVGLDYLNLASEQGDEYASQMLENITAHKDFYIAQSSINLMYYLSGLIQNNNSAQRSRSMSRIEKRERLKTNKKIVHMG
jgi:hypothetical protein